MSVFQTITAIITTILATSGLCMGACSLVYAKLPAWRYRQEAERKLKGSPFWWRVSLNMLFSVACVYTFLVFPADYLYNAEPIVWWKGLLQVVAVLGVYDFLYYFLHRYPFHQWSVLKRVHGVHHQARAPKAIDSLFLHPVENFLALLLFAACVWLVGPVNVYWFGLTFIIHNWFNILVHAGVDLHVPYIRSMTKKHHKHHEHMRGGNFASLSPLPDMLFGTTEQG